WRFMQQDDPPAYGDSALLACLVALSVTGWRASAIWAEQKRAFTTAPPVPRAAPPDTWLDGLVARWCGPGDTTWTWDIEKAGPSRVHTSADGERPGRYWSISESGRGRFLIVSETNPSERLVYRFLSDDSFQLWTPLGVGYRERPFTRCGPPQF